MLLALEHHDKVAFVMITVEHLKLAHHSRVCSVVPVFKLESHFAVTRLLYPYRLTEFDVVDLEMFWEHLNTHGVDGVASKVYLRLIKWVVQLDEWTVLLI